MWWLFFFFQAEDGIRDIGVTGVQTCALPIFQSALGLGTASEKDFIKRVIGLPGDVVSCCTDGKVTVNGQPLDEPYVYLSASKAQAPFETVTVPPGHLFLMGDHRDGSADSRFHGPVPIEKVVGRAFAVFFPFNRIRVLEVPEPFDQAALPASPAPAPAGDPDVLGLVVPALAPRLRRSTD